MNHKKAADAGVRPGGNHPRQTRAKNGERQGRTLPLDHINRQLNGQLRKASIFAELMQAMMPIPINDRGTHFGHLSSATSQAASSAPSLCCSADRNKADHLEDHGLTVRVGDVRLVPSWPRRAGSTAPRDRVLRSRPASNGNRRTLQVRLEAQGLLKNPQRLGATELPVDDWRTLSTSAMDMNGTTPILGRRNNHHVLAPSDAAVAGRSTSSLERASSEPGAVRCNLSAPRSIRRISRQNGGVSHRQATKRTVLWSDVKFLWSTDGAASICKNLC
jgi:hypothetical protein